MPGVSRRGVFLSYRRDDAGPYARLLQLLLSQRVPDALVFMDLDSIEPGLDFAEVIEEALNSCAVLVALIGRQWATVTDEDGARRLDNPDDYVRFEVTTALERGVRVIPVLIDGARALRRQDLPEELHKLARLNAAKLSFDRYRDDADRLLDLIQRVLAEVGEEPETGRERELPARDAGNSAGRQAQEEATHQAEEAEVKVLGGRPDVRSDGNTGGERILAPAAWLFADAERAASSITDEDGKESALSRVAEARAITDPDRARSPQELFVASLVVQAALGKLLHLSDDDVFPGSLAVHALHGVGQVVGFDPPGQQSRHIVMRFGSTIGMVDISELFRMPVPSIEPVDVECSGQEFSEATQATPPVSPPVTAAQSVHPTSARPQPT